MIDTAQLTDEQLRQAIANTLAEYQRWELDDVDRALRAWREYWNLNEEAIRRKTRKAA